MRGRAKLVRIIPFIAVVVGTTAAGGRQIPDPPPDPSAEPPVAVRYDAPVDAPVSAGFDAPEGPYGPGNRGIEYATRPGQPVRASAAGIVTFAGPVAGARFVTVLHADRVRTTYGRLATVTTAVGRRVAPGDIVGTAARSCIWTARLGGAYLDPFILLAASGRPVVRLVADRPTAATVGPARHHRFHPVSATAVAWALGVATGGQEATLEPRGS